MNRPTLVLERGREGDETFEIELKKGWNVLLVKVANAGKPAFGVRLAGDGLQTAGSPSELPVTAGGPSQGP